MYPAQPTVFAACSLRIYTAHWCGVERFRVRPSKHQPCVLSPIGGLFDAVYKNGRTLCREDLLWDTSGCWSQATRDSCFGEGVTDTVQLLKESELVSQFNIVLIRSYPFIGEGDFQLGLYIP